MQIGLVTHYVETARRFALNSKELGEKARDSQPVSRGGRAHNQLEPEIGLLLTSNFKRPKSKP